MNQYSGRVKKHTHTCGLDFFQRDKAEQVQKDNPKVIRW